MNLSSLTISCTVFGLKETDTSSPVTPDNSTTPLTSDPSTPSNKSSASTTSTKKLPIGMYLTVLLVSLN